MRKCILGWSNLTYPSHSNANRRVQTEIMYSGLLVHHKSQPLEPADVFFIAKCQQQYWWENGTFSMVQIKKKEKKRKTEQKRTGSTDQLRHHSFSTYAKYFEKLKSLTPLCAYHWVRNVSFSENFA